MTFLSFVSALRTTENAVKSGGWMILDAAETLFLTARQRVFGAKDSFKKESCWIRTRSKIHLQY